MRRALLGLAVITAGGAAAMHPGAVKAFYLGIYPTDPAKAEALNLCFTENHAFNRLDAGEREACYRHILNAANAVSAVSTASIATPVANPVDLRQAAGEGQMPRNDIRRLEQAETVPHPPR